MPRTFCRNSSAGPHDFGIELLDPTSRPRLEFVSCSRPAGATIVMRISEPERLRTSFASAAAGIEIDAIVISHMHADHFIDLIALRYALR